ncbi:hypothetical protein Tco_0971459 [Tanacetum coccineum]
MDDDTTTDEQAYSSSGEDIVIWHTFMDWYCKKQGITGTDIDKKTWKALLRNCQSLSSRRSSSTVPNGRMPQTSHRSSRRCNPKGPFTFRDKYGVQMLMRFNEIHKFSDGTLQQIDEALDYRVKEFRVNRMNPGFDTRFWTKKDIDRSNEFMFSIQKRLKTRRIFRNLESFVGGKIREGDYQLLKRTE